MKKLSPSDSLSIARLVIIQELTLPAPVPDEEKKLS